MRKAQLILRLMRERDHWELLLNYVGATRMTIRGVTGSWSVHDIISHVMIREEYLADRLSEVAEGRYHLPCKTQDELETFLEEYGYPDFESPLISDKIADDWVVNKYKTTPPKFLVEREIHAFDSVLSGIKALSEHQLNEQSLFQLIRKYTYEHFREHAVEIRKRFKTPVKR
jgi:hypothetical protein